MFYGICNLPWWGYPLVVFLLTHITITGVTIYLHRNQAHRALDLHPSVSHFFRFWLWLTTGMITKTWAAIHRKHHATCETPDDPHSPQVFGLPLVLWQGGELYRKEATNAETLDRYGKGTPDDWIEREIYTKGTNYGKYIMLAIDLILFGVPGFAIWAIQMAWIPFFAAGVVNGVGHYWGYRNFECPDAATNISPIGILIGGEELHNNHHTYPTSAKFSVKKWEFDIGWLYIRILESLGLAKAKRVPPHPHLIPGKTQVDIAALKGIITNRFQVMSNYSKEVILPIFRQEKEKVSMQEAGKWDKTKVLLVKEVSLLDSQSKETLAQFLAKNSAIQVVYQFKEQLQNLWAQSALRENELLEALQNWCKEAEATGISALQEFAAYLRSFSEKTA